MSPKHKAPASKPKAKRKHYRRIATEEAFSIPEQMDAQRELVAAATEYDPDLFLWKIQTDPAGPVYHKLLDLFDQRLRTMDEYDVDMHLLALTSTGVQMMSPDKGNAVAAIGNDRLREAIERGLQYNLGAVGILSEQKYWPILEAIAELKVPLYIHPRSPIPLMAKAFRTDHLEHAIWGYQAETGLHGLRIITSGVLDHFPTLQIVLGHMGEGIPYWLYRLDFMHGRVRIGFDRPKLKLTPSEYFKRNFYITTSGMNWEPTLKFCIEAVGADRIMWAVDYPYQDHPDAVDFLDAARIPEKDKQKIYHENAERIFKLKKKR